MTPGPEAVHGAFDPIARPHALSPFAAFVLFISTMTIFVAEAGVFFFAAAWAVVGLVNLNDTMTMVLYALALIGTVAVVARFVGAAWAGRYGNDEE